MPRFGFFTLLLWVFCTSAFARSSSVAVLGVVDLAKMRDNSTATYSAKPGFGGMIGVNLPIMGDLSLDFGLGYITRKTQSTLQGDFYDDITTTSKTIQLPVLARYWLTDYLSAGAGVYFLRYFGSLGKNELVSVNSTSTTPLFAQSTSEDYAAANRKTSEYGLVASVQVAFPFMSAMSVLVDARYLYGISDNSVDVAKSLALKYSDFQLMAGIGFPL